ncbi:MAG: cysteine--1-D-myo-inosityl 2-amino-2-deoxy-alpha-D-glucopyranoside ligase [Terrimesophilobacter sp.]
MKSWNTPEMPQLSGHGPLPRIYNTSLGEISSIEVDTEAQLYVCGITPYDATHIGHANTYLTYDTLNRVLRDAGITVSYVQNVTDVDDPLLERATATGVDWRELAESQIELFRGDMKALGIIPPKHYVGVVESVVEIGAACARLLDDGYAYWVPTDGGDPDLYFDLAAAQERTTWYLGQESRLDRPTMLELSAERGGDPARPGKRDPLDPLLWRSAREGEPSWGTAIGSGRPGWHIECSVIGGHYLSAPITVNGGGFDLVFPHHEMSAAHSAALNGSDWSHTYSHAGMVAYEGEKMSKSRGNLVFVSKLIAEGVDPRAIRLALLAHHYRSDWEWTHSELHTAEARLKTWQEWAQSPFGHSGALVAELRSLLADDLNTPGALAAVDAAITAGEKASPSDLDAISALLGIGLHSAS